MCKFKTCSSFLIVREMTSTFDHGEQSPILPWIMITVNNSDEVASDEDVEKGKLINYW